MKVLTEFNYIPLASEITDASVMHTVGAAFSPGLAALNGHEVERSQVDWDKPLALLVISGGTEALISQLLARRPQSCNQEPMLLIAHPGNNSLAASLEALAHIRQKNIKGEIIFFQDASDAKTLAQLREKIHFISAFRKLHKSRMGLVGKASEWLVASTYANPVFAETWGVKVSQYPLQEVFASFPQEASPVAEMPGFDTSSPIFRKAYAVYEILHHLVSSEQLDALSVECFTLFLRYQTHGCFALSKLNDEGLTAGCEGDLASTLTMLWIRYLVGQASWMANPVEIDSDKNTLWLAHCTVPISLVTRHEEATHFETGCGVAVAGTLIRGPVTLARIGGSRLDKIWMAEAEIIDTGTSPQRCRTQALLQFRDTAPLQELLKNPLGNHVVLTPGWHAAALRAWWEMFKG